MQLDARAIAAEVENSVRQVQPAGAGAAAMEAVPADSAEYGRKPSRSWSFSRASRCSFRESVRLPEPCSRR